MTKKIYIDNMETDYVIDSNGIITNTKTGKELKGTITQHGYQRIVLSINGRKIGKYLHRLVAIYFLNFDETSDKIVNHIDGNKLNNSVNNLEIISQRENLLHAYKNDLKISNQNKKCVLFEENLPDEKWLKIPNYEDYEVSDKGRIKSLKYNTPIILRPCIRCGYESVVLCRDGLRKHHQIHDLVYFTFTGEQKEAMKVIDHIDGNKTNNRLDNLRYVSRKETYMPHFMNKNLFLLAEALKLSKMAKNKFFTQLHRLRRLLESMVARLVKFAEAKQKRHMVTLFST